MKKEETHLKTKITPQEYQKLDYSDQLKYSRFSGTYEVYYILVSYLKTRF